jgi:hypothetical protein
MKNTKKTVQIKEADLVKLMTKIVSETVEKEKAQIIESEKKKWIAEQQASNEKLLESAIARLKKELNG